jgi:hypothetical protein
MKPHHYNRTKLSAIMSYDLYMNLDEWYRSLSPMPYPVPFESRIYKKTSDRFYLSKWLECFIVFYVKHKHTTWIAIKVDNRGKAIMVRDKLQYMNGRTDTKLSIAGYRKDANQINGEPDIKILRPMQMPLYFEVKIGNDTLSQAQKDFITAGYGVVEVVKTVDDFMDKIKKYEYE